ncbi:hypothetical protein D3C80_881200 [compost metagenome]
MIGRRGGVGEHHRHFALGEQAISFRPAGSDGQNPVPEFRPGFRRLVAIDGLYPEQKAETRRRGARVLNGDLLRSVPLDQILEALRRVLDRLRIVDDGEVAVVIGNERVVCIIAGNLDGTCIDAVRLEKAGRLGFRNQTGIEAERDIGFRSRTFQL